MSLIGRLAVVLLALVAALALAAPALGQVAPSELSQTDVAIDAGASVSDDDREALEASASELSSAGSPTKYVVLAERPADPTAYARSIREAVGAEWTVLVLSPSNLRIDSPLPSSAEQAAFEEERGTLQDDAIGGTIAVAERLSEEAGNPVAGGSSDEGGDEGGNGAVGLALIGGLIVVGGGGALLLSRRAQKQRRERSAAADRAELDPLIDGLAAQITDLDGDMEMGGARAAAAKADYEAATWPTARPASCSRRCRFPRRPRWTRPATCWRRACGPPGGRAPSSTAGRSRRPTRRRCSKACAPSTPSTARP